ncbi:hypothetical protein LCGC14_1389540 [marine sediment metagenome]|uniref:Uncharacterized protein n=1 Tax=marine sediment metagenome TaxID=412755 RepID=A0A0F9MFX1_9ZZZZ
MAMITLRLKDGHKEGEITLENQGTVSYAAAKSLLYEIMGTSKDTEEIKETENKT